MAAVARNTASKVALKQQQYKATHYSDVQLFHAELTFTAMTKHSST
jgi:hypothetical protein